jgi:hypothetical protein
VDLKVDIKVRRNTLSLSTLKVEVVYSSETFEGLSSKKSRSFEIMGELSKSASSEFLELIKYGDYFIF